jgi:voltage-gated potassium channel
MTFRHRLYLTLEPKERGGVIEQIFEFFLITIIILNIVAIILASVQDYYLEHKAYFNAFEIFSVTFFTLEYVVRLYAIVENPHYKSPITGRLNYMRSGMALIDLMAILPFYLTFLPIDLRFLRIFRLMALFRMFKITRYLRALEIFKRVVFERREQLMLSFIFIMFILVIISFFMYYIEREAQPERFGSIPDAMWWGIATLTTIGYGDTVPITGLGKFMGGIIALAGVAILALPAGILSSGFFELLHKPKGNKHTCPHCGKDFHD